MRLVCLSDTHGLHSKINVPDGDVLIHAGDFCNYGNFDELIGFNAWLGTLPHRHKLIVPGNHDRCVQENLEHARILLGNATVLVDQEIIVEGLKFYFSPWTPAYGYWSFMRPRGEAMAEKWENIPEGLDVLVTHGPPAGILDAVPRRMPDGRMFENCGCQDLYNRVMIVKPKHHIFGHIHAMGSQKQTENGIAFYNVASCDEDYRCVNAPVVIEVST